jgi:hypothetical protein
MTKEEIKQYLRDNLSIEVVLHTRNYYDSNEVKVSSYLKLEGEIISGSFDRTTVCSSQ